jgi:hypothetical protein
MNEAIEPAQLSLVSFIFSFKFALPVLLPVLYLVGWFNFRH